MKINIYNYNISNIYRPNILNPCSYVDNKNSLKLYQGLHFDCVVFGGRKNKFALNIEGYNKEKSIVENILIEPLKYNMELPPSVLLSFPDKYMEQEFIADIKKRTNTKFSQVNSGSKNLQDDIDFEVQNAKNEYLETGKPTILLIEDVERAIGMTPAYAKDFSLIPLDIDDYNILSKLQTDSNKISYFKSFLDDVKRNNFSSDKSNYITVLFTTTKPQYIHPDLITRDGKIKTIIFPYPKGVNAKHAMRNEIKKAISQDYVSTKISESILKDMENIPYDKLAHFIAPSPKDGALSYERYYEIALKSLQEYQKHHKKPYSYYYITNIIFSKKEENLKQYLDYESMRYLFS